MSKAQEYTRNAALHMLAMLEDGFTDVSGIKTRVPSLQVAKQIKLGKLSRCIRKTQAQAHNPKRPSMIRRDLKARIPAYREVMRYVANVKSVEALERTAGLR